MGLGTHIRNAITKYGIENFDKIIKKDSSDLQSLLENGWKYGRKIKWK